MRSRRLTGRLDAVFARRAEYGPLFIRLVVGWMLIWGTQDNIFSWKQMVEFERFLASRGVPAPMVAAHLSVYAQFVCGVLVILGAFTRLAAVLLVVNFVCALLIAHRTDTWAGAFPALVMLASALFFLFHGPGKLSVDEGV
ncbi:MAG TPA: DoxX family protein [Pyrinomonadaceae bacterium]|nr:DoxX family protein [Pyrinomonadaceae bacterium]